MTNREKAERIVDALICFENQGHSTHKDDKFLWGKFNEIRKNFNDVHKAKEAAMVDYVQKVLDNEL